jgi:amino acid adenylation domain-containing protein
MEERVIEGYRLSPQQKRLWLLQEHLEGPAFCAQCEVLIEGPADAACLKAALQSLVERHHVLRTTFHCFYGMTIPVQVVADEHCVLEAEQDYRLLSPREQNDRTEQALLEARNREFDVRQGPILRGSLLQLSPERYLLLMTLPALCCDSVGFVNFTRELAREYLLLAGGDVELEEPLQYVTASEWQNDLLEGDDFEVGKEYWGRHDLSQIADTPLPFGEHSIVSRAFDPDYVEIEIGESYARTIQVLARRYGVGPSTFFLACWQALLGRLTGQSALVVGVSCDGRTDEDAAGAIGLFERYLPVTANVADAVRFSDLLKATHKSVLDVAEWQDWFTWEAASHSAGTDAGALFFPLSFEFEDQAARVASREVTFSIRRRYVCTDRFELKLACTSTSTGGSMAFHYNKRLFSGLQIELLGRRFQTLVQDAIDNGETCVGDLNILPDAERRQLLIDFNNTRSPFPHAQSMAGMFDAQANRTPDSVALVYEDEYLSYAELSKSASRIGNHLIGRAIGAEDVVGVYVNRSLEALVAVLGVLKAGSAYLPLDPGSPAERIDYVLSDASAAVLLSNQRLIPGLAGRKGFDICLDLNGCEIQAESEVSRPPSAETDSLAYVIYTSGSTGRPKGVMVSHRSALNLLEALKRSAYADQDMTSLVASLNAPLAFDASVQQVVLLLCGATLHIIPEALRTDGMALLAYLEERSVDVFDCTPAQLRLLMDAGLLNSGTTAPRKILTAGEAIDDDLWGTLESAAAPVIYNIYGPTECTVDATFCKISGSPGKPVVGHPLANYKVYVVDHKIRPAPAGVVGELHLGGVGVARGYLNRPDLTAARFVPDPFSETEGARLYSTGDLARLQFENGIEFLGRLDNQVKLRGNRIELGEIEAVLLQHGGVRQCVVSLRGGAETDKRLAAYVVPGEHTPDVAELRDYLRKKLPDYMIPSAFLYLKALPLTSNGKVNRNALPADAPNSTENAIGARDHIELQLLYVWRDVLQIDGLGIRDNFFELGGHSLKAVALSSRVSELYGEKVPVRLVFDYPTVEQMASYVRREVGSGLSSAAVPIQPRGTRRPFFCVHPSGGVVYPFLPLSRSLGADQPFYGLQSYELDGGNATVDTVEEIAGRYVADIRRVQPAGPYQIGGFSFGGIVAYEMAQQLSAAGEEISILAIFDTGLPTVAVEDRPLSPEEVADLLRESFVRRASELGVSVDENEPIAIEELAEVTLRREKEEGKIPAEVSEEQYIQFRQNMETYPHASRRYRPKPYAGRLSLFRGNGSDDRGHDYGWSKWAMRGVEVFCFDVPHFAFMQAPNSAALAVQLAECFESAESALADLPLSACADPISTDIETIL